MTKKILITGASGVIGRKLTELLLAGGYSVCHLSRNARSGSVPAFAWQVEKNQMDPQALAGVDTIINLAGESVAGKRWTTSRKKEIMESRTKSCALLLETLRQTPHQVKTLVSASAIGYYGYASHDIRNEESPAGTDFLAEVTRQWEEQVDKINALGIRVVKLRIGIVLSNQGGALMEMAKPVAWWVGSPLGTGLQFLTWIHIDDLCRMVLHVMVNEGMRGAYNAVGPEWVTNAEMTKAIAKVLHKPLLFPAVPGFVLRMVIGEMADIVLTGSKISSSKIEQTGFKCQFTKLESALNDLLG